MLVLSRQRDESILIGDEGTSHVQVADTVIGDLKATGRPALIDLADELVASRAIIDVSCVDIRGDKVRIGVNAPKIVSVHRKEVFDAIRRENRAAAQVKPEDVSGLGGGQKGGAGA